MEKLNGKFTYSKAAAAAVVAGLTALSTALTDGVITGQEWTVIIIATIIGSGFVMGAPSNKLPDSTSN